MGRDARARGFFSILGPGMDFYRVPMGGRNFEYMTGEDPYSTEGSSGITDVHSSSGDVSTEGTPYSEW